jgi:hypothetical protein
VYSKYFTTRNVQAHRKVMNIYRRNFCVCPFSKDMMDIAIVKLLPISTTVFKHARYQFNSEAPFAKAARLAFLRIMNAVKNPEKNMTSDAKKSHMPSLP